MQLPSPELLARCRRGNRDAMAELFSQICGDVLRTAYLLVGNKADAEDACQNVFVRLLLGFNRYDESRPFRPWLYRIVVNEARAVWRRRRSFWQRLKDNDGQTTDCGPEDKALAAERSRILQNALTDLPEHHRSVVVLRYMSGLEIREIAHALRCPAGTVKSRLYYAQRALQSSPVLREFWDGSDKDEPQS